MLTREREIGRSLQKADQQDRALLDLSLRRKVKDDVVAAVLRLQPEEVVHHRAAALDRLAADLGIYDDAERARLSDILAELPDEEWPDEGAEATTEPAPPSEPPAPPEPPQPSTPAPSAAEKPSRSRRPLLAAIVIVVGALLGGLIGLLLFGGDSDDDAKTPAAQAPAAPPAKSAQLTALAPDFPAQGTARIEGSGADSRLVLSLRDLPPREEAYAVWLYNDLTDAVLVDRVVGGSLDVNKRLPADPSNYKFIDVSREPIDDNPNHSGASLMRVPIAELTK